MDWDPRATTTDGYVCPPCPVFHPTLDEFRHPLKYISSIRHIGMQAGICKIVPPAGWQPPFAINEKTFRFRTRVQQLNCIDGHTRAESNFVETLRMFLYRNGTPMQELPRVDGGELLNLLGLFKNVAELGGYSAVCDGNLWGQVVRRVGRSAASDRPSNALCHQYQKHYEACLLAYERRDEPQFQTPDVTKKSGKKKTGASSTAASAASSTTPSEKTRSSMKKKQSRDKGTDATTGGTGIDNDSQLSPSTKQVKRTLFSDGGHTSSEESDALMVDSAVGTKRKTRGVAKRIKAVIEEEEADEHSDEGDEDDFDMDEDEEDYDEHEKKKSKQPRKTAAELEPRALKPDPKRRTRLEPPEVFTGQRFYHFIPDDGAKIGEVQRVVRGKKPHVFVKYDDGSRDTVDLSTLQLVIANGWNAEAAEVAFKSELCQTCLRGDCWDHLLLCDSCNGGHHLFCLDVPLKDVPSGDWYCDQCVQESLEPARENNPKFGFEMGSEYTLAAYKEKADNWKRSYFGSKTDEEAEKLSDRDLEHEYWRILGTPLHEQRLEVEYGSDIDSGSVGSGFPRPDDYLKSMKVLSRRLRILSDQKGATPTQRKLCEVFSRGIDEALVDGNTTGLEELLKTYATDGWNLNNLPKFSGSVLQHLDEDIKGVMVPWVYIGMCFSTFCWHVEDHNFYSISYLHRGAPKTWYGVPCAKAEYFESVMKKLTPELFGGQPDLHLQLVTMFSPKTLIEHGVPVYRATHGPNEFIVTFPSAYHGGFNNGFNCAEAVNFATVDWLPWGAKSVLNYRKFSKLPVFAHEALVVSLAETVLESHSFTYESTKTHVVPAVVQMVKDWNAFEDSLVSNRVTRHETMAEYARRHGMNESEAIVAIGATGGVGPHSRSCKMTMKSNVSDSPEKTEDNGMKSRAGTKMAARPTGKMQPSTGLTLTARPTRMVLWAGNSGKTDGLRCTTCKQYCYLQAVVCTKCRHHSSVGCMEHYPTMCKCDAEEFYVYLHRYERSHLPGVLDGIEQRLSPVENWLTDCRATFGDSNSTKPPVSIIKKLLSVGLQCGGAPQEKLDELEEVITEASKWTETAEKFMKAAAAADVLPDLARMISEVDRLRVIPDGIERVESFLGEWTKCKADAERLVEEVRAIEQTESELSTFDIQSESQDTESLWSENEQHLDAIRRLVDVSDRAESTGQPLPHQLADRVHEAKQYLRVLIAANEMLAVITRFTKAKTAAQPSPAGTAAVTPALKPADVAVIMESDCRHVIMQADVLERDLQLSIFKIKILRSLLRVTEAESDDLKYALDDYSKSFEELDSLWRRLRSLPICPDRLDELGKRLTLCKSWEHRAKKLVDAVTRTASAAAARHSISWDEVLARPDLEEAERFYDEADRHFVPVSSFVRRQMHSRLQDCRRWYSTMHGLFVRSPMTPGSPSLPQFLRTVGQNLINPPVHAHATASTPAAMQLYCICAQVLCEHASYVGCSRCQLLFHTQCISHPVGVSTPFVCVGCREIPPAPRSYVHTKREIPSPPYPMFCMCRGPEDSSMICCDVCDEWYHTACIGMSAEAMNQAEAYRCPRCAIQQNLYYLDKKALRRGALGRRPVVSRIDSMLLQLQTALIALPPGTHELLQYLRHVKDVETRVRIYVADFASDFSVASFTSLDYCAEQQKLLSLMQELTSLEVHLETAIGNLSAIHWSLRACELVLGCEHAPKYSHLVILLDDAKLPNFVFPRPEYHHIQQTIEDRVVRATQWLKLAKTLEAEEWNTERARQLVFQYHELAQFLELPASEVELVFGVAGERIPTPPQILVGTMYDQRHQSNSTGRHQQRVV